MQTITRRNFMYLGAAALAAAGGIALPGCSAYERQATSAATTSAASSAAAMSDASTSAASSAHDIQALYLPTEADGLAGVEFFAFDTVCTVKAYTTTEVLQALFERCIFFEKHLSRHIEGSDVSNINEAGGKPVQVAPETADVIRRSLDYSAQSDGMFDITIGAAAQLWDFDEGIVPDESALAEAVKHIGWHGVSVEDNTVQLADPETRIDLGGIAKGYIADDLASILREAACPGAFINLGGNVYALGTKADGRAWNVGLQDPNDARGQLIGKVAATDVSVVTSGLYERNFERDGVLYYHILDPHTGAPVKTDVASTTVVSTNSIDGDVYATILFLNGMTDALALLESTDGLEGLVIDEHGQAHMSAGFEWEPVGG